MLIRMFEVSGTPVGRFELTVGGRQQPRTEKGNQLPPQGDWQLLDLKFRKLAKFSFRALSCCDHLDGLSQISLSLSQGSAR